MSKKYYLQEEPCGGRFIDDYVHPDCELIKETMAPSIWDAALKMGEKCSIKRPSQRA